MNYDKARQYPPDSGVWYYTSSNDGKYGKTGACSPLQNCPACKGYDCEACDHKGYIELSEEETCQGHTTPEEAYEHQTEWVIEYKWRTGQELDVMRPCKAPGCGEWTQCYVMVGHTELYNLCDEHRNKEVVRELMGTVGEVWWS